VAKVIAIFSMGFVLVLSALGLSTVTRDLAFEIPATEIGHFDGYMYQVPLKNRFVWPWQPLNDHQFSPRRSDLVLYQDERQLGPPHALHDDIKQRGGGLYSHWGRYLYFASSDNTDPSSNGRRYHGTLTTVISPQLLREIAQIGGAFLLLGVGLLVWLRRRVLAVFIQQTACDLRVRAPDYAWAVAIPAIASFVASFLLPPVWNGSDSVIWLRWQWHWIPHHPPIYPAFMALAKEWSNSATSVVQFVSVIQHTATVLAIAYLASALRERWKILTLSTAATVGAAFGLYAQGLYTEGLATAFFLVFLGAVLRLHRGGPTLRMLAMLALALLTASLTRHAYLFFAVVPVVYLGVAGLVSRDAPWRVSLRSVSVIIALVGSVTLANNLVVRYACVMLDSQCISIVGRAGVYRMQDAYALVPEPQREAWLRTLVERAPDRLVAAAIPLMVTTPNPWTGPRDAIGLDIRFAGQSEDRLMNAGFESFLLWPDRFVLLQWWRQLQLAVLGPGTPDYCRGYPSCVFEDSARSVETVFPADSRSVAAVSGTGADDPAMGAVYRALEQHVVTRVADWLLPLVPARRILFLTASLLLGLAAMLRVRESGFTVLLLTLWLGAVAYALALTLVTVVLPRYVLPIDNVLWVVNGIALVALLAQRDPLQREPG
jgi:hypothetical protein